MTEEQKYQVESEEIDLIDYARVLIKRKWAMFSIVLIAVIAAGIFSFLAPKVYKIETVLEIGSIGDGTAAVIEDPAQVVEKLKGDSYGVLVRENLNISEEKYPKKSVDNPIGTTLVKITINSSNTQQAKSILEEIITLIIDEHNKKIETNTVLIAENIKTVEEKIKLTQSDIEKTKNKIGPIDGNIIRIENKIRFAGEEKQNLEAKVEALQKVLVYQQDPGTQFALFDTKEKLANKKQEIENLYLEINDLKSGKEDLGVKINSMKSSIEGLNSEINSLKASLGNVRPTKVIKEPTVSETPVSPRLLLNMAIAGVLGLFLGLFFVFFLEWLEKNKQRL